MLKRVHRAIILFQIPNNRRIRLSVATRLLLFHRPNPTGHQHRHMTFMQDHQPVEGELALGAEAAIGATADIITPEAAVDTTVTTTAMVITIITIAVIGQGMAMTNFIIPTSR